MYPLLLVASHWGAVWGLGRNIPPPPLLRLLALRVSLRRVAPAGGSVVAALEWARVALVVAVAFGTAVVAAGIILAPGNSPLVELNVTELPVVLVANIVGVCVTEVNTIDSP